MQRLYETIPPHSGTRDGGAQYPPPTRTPFCRHGETKGSTTFPIVLASAEDFAGRTYGVSEAPVSLLLNGEGQAICRYVGADPGSEQVLETEIRILLGLDPRP